MTTRSSPPLAPGSAVAAPRGPLSRLIDRVLALGPVAWLVPILEIYNAAGGGLLAAGLAFSSLFAILPAILLVIGVVGVVLGDTDRLNALTTSLAAAFPPMADFFTVALASFASGATTYSLIGLIFLAWGASRFYQSLDEALARIFQSTKRRGVLLRNILGILWVIVLTSWSSASSCSRACSATARRSRRRPAGRHAGCRRRQPGRLRHRSCPRLSVGSDESA